MKACEFWGTFFKLRDINLLYQNGTQKGKGLDSGAPQGGVSP